MLNYFYHFSFRFMSSLKYFTYHNEATVLYTSYNYNYNIIIWFNLYFFKPFYYLYKLFLYLTVITFSPGLVSRKSEANVMVKNMLDVVVGGLGFWVIGYGIAFGKNNSRSSAFVGANHFGIDIELDEAPVFAKFLSQMAFATTATTIVSG